MVILDTETTGVGHDARIIELAILSADVVTFRFNPGIPIPAEATAIHGITDADVANCATFAEQAPDVLAHLNGDDTIAGYNVKFDLLMIQSELSRAGLPPLDLTHKTLICALRYWQHHEPRTLTAAVERFLGRPHTGAHGAAADVRATRDVLEAMRAQFGGDLDVADSMPERASWCGPTDDLLWRDGVVVLNFGKYKGTPLHELDTGMLTWLTKNARARHVQDAAKVALMVPGEFVERARRRFNHRR